MPADEGRAMPRGAPFLDGARGSVLGAPAQDVDTDFEHLLAGGPAVGNEALDARHEAAHLGPLRPAHGNLHSAKCEPELTFPVCSQPSRRNVTVQSQKYLADEAARRAR